MGKPGLLGVRGEDMTAVFGQHAFTDDERDALIERIIALRPRLTQRQLATRLGVSQSTIVRLSALARERGLMNDDPRYLTPERRAELVEELSRPGWKLMAVARKYGITKGAVYYHARKHGFVQPGTPRES